MRCLKDPQTTLISNLKTNSVFNLIPNPCSDYLYLDSKDIQAEKIVIYSVDGKIIKSALLKDEKGISVSNIKNGIYIIKIYSEKNSYIDKLIIR